MVEWDSDLAGVMGSAQGRKRVGEGRTYRRSNIRIEPSAPTVAKMFLPVAKAMSKTSLSCAINWVFTFCVCKRATLGRPSRWAQVLQQPHTSMSHMVQVVSILAVPSRVGSVSFQSKEVIGEQYSLFLLCEPRQGNHKGRAYGSLVKTYITEHALQLHHLLVSHAPKAQVVPRCSQQIALHVLRGVPHHLGGWVRMVEFSKLKEFRAGFISVQLNDLKSRQA